ncbi:ATP-grasp domain-containing protein, partial [Staphylococcus epidermidis]|uniref:ATP-grasp domain-containing protein n=1 Tax=Staphylococcus epidermidis TaxID=1282 RepID=UPI0037DA0C5F
FTAQQPLQKPKQLNSHLYLLKPQIHPPPTPKPPPVKIPKSLSQLQTYPNQLLPKQFLTHQTPPHPKHLKPLYIQQPSHIQKQYYLPFLIHPPTHKLTLMTSEEPPTEIQQLPAQTPQ